MKTANLEEAPQIECSTGINSSTRTRFGYIAQVFALEILLQEEGDYVALKAGKEVIRKFDYQAETDYEVKFDNFDPHQSMQHASNPDQPSHLQFYYTLLQMPPTNRVEIHEMCGGGGPSTKGGQPYRCGGIEIEGERPLK